MRSWEGFPRAASTHWYLASKRFARSLATTACASRATRWAQLTQEIPCDYMCVNCLLTENCSLRDERVDQEMRELGEIE